jgi:hypothetical protein
MVATKFVVHFDCINRINISAGRHARLYLFRILMDMKSYRYSFLYAFTLSTFLLVMLKSHALILYWQQSRHILLDIVPPPSMSDLFNTVRGEQLGAEFLAGWHRVEQDLMTLGLAPWPEHIASHETEEMVDYNDMDELELPQRAVVSQLNNINHHASVSPRENHQGDGSRARIQTRADADHAEFVERHVVQNDSIDGHLVNTQAEQTKAMVQPEQASAQLSGAQEPTLSSPSSQRVDKASAADATARLIAAQTGLPAKSAYVASVSTSPQLSSDKKAEQPPSIAATEANTQQAVTANTSPTLEQPNTAMQATAAAPAATSSSVEAKSHSTTEHTTASFSSEQSLAAISHIDLNPNDNVLLIGDSLMQGLAPHLMVKFNKKHRMQTVDMSRHSTGLTYPAFYNWPEAVRQAYEKQVYDVLIVFMGANDPWDMTIKGRYIRFGSERWVSVYSERVRAILDVAKAHGSRVIWLSTPPMGREDLKDKIPRLNQIYKTEIAKYAHHARFVDTATVLTTDGVSYARFLQLPERGSVMLRTDDGIHFTTQGHRILSKLTFIQFRWPHMKNKS